MRRKRAWMASWWSTTPEECEEFAAQGQGIDLIFLLAPTSTDQRMQQVARVASGYVYYVSLKGVPAPAPGHRAVEQALPRIRAHVKIPVGVGFGIRDAPPPGDRQGGRRGGHRHQSSS